MKSEKNYDKTNLFLYKEVCVATKPWLFVKNFCEIENGAYFGLFVFYNVFIN